MFQMRGAHSAYSIYGTTYCESSAGCPRVNFLRQHGIESTPDERSQYTWAVGRANEEVTIAQLTKAGTPHKVEMDISYPITDNVSFFGHEDIVLNPDTDPVPWELKSVSSTKQYEKIFVNGMFKYENLCQLLAYMIGLNVFKGYLRYTNFIWHSAGKDKWRAVPGVRSFEVTVNELGEVFVDGVLTLATIAYVRDHQTICAQMLDNNSFAVSRPKNPRDPHNSFAAPCTMCDFRLICEKYESGALKNLDEIKQFFFHSIGGQNDGY